MRQLRECDSAQLYTGVSKCPPDFGKMKAAILVKPGTKLPADLTEEELERLVHADREERIYGIVGFCEYAKNGYEVQTSAKGYGSERVTGISARKDTFDLDKFYPELDASLMATSNVKWDVYFIDEDSFIHGMDDGTDVLAGYPMSSVYGESTPFPTSSEQASMQVVFCHVDAKKAKRYGDYVPLGFRFDPDSLVLGILPVKLVKGEDGYKLHEAKGGYDLTGIYGPLIATAADKVLEGATAATYNAATKTLVIADGGEVRLKAPSVLYEHGIKGIEQIA